MTSFISLEDYDPDTNTEVQHVIEKTTPQKSCVEYTLSWVGINMSIRCHGWESNRQHISSDMHSMALIDPNII